MTAVPCPLPRLTLVLGGARSGKSARAEALVAAHTARFGGPAVYVATAQALDDEMAARIAEHRARRSGDWETVEEPFALTGVLARDFGGRAVLVDCLTLWLTNILLAEHDVEKEEAALVEALSRAAGPIVCVSNEVGWGIVPDNALARRFRDAAGRLNRKVATVADRVELVAAGLPLPLKS